MISGYVRASAERPNLCRWTERTDIDGQEEPGARLPASREWEIARLLALGLSNAEIADRLVVWPKTVGHHVSAVLAKLAVRRRAEVAAAMREVDAPI